MMLFVHKPPTFTRPLIVVAAVFTLAVLAVAPIRVDATEVGVRAFSPVVYAEGFSPSLPASSPAYAGAVECSPATILSGVAVHNSCWGAGARFAGLAAACGAGFTGAGTAFKIWRIGRTIVKRMGAQNVIMAALGSCGGAFIQGTHFLECLSRFGFEASAAVQLHEKVGSYVEQLEAMLAEVEGDHTF